MMQQPAPGLRGIARATGELRSSLALPDGCWETAACPSKGYSQSCSGAFLIVSKEPERKSLALDSCMK